MINDFESRFKAHRSKTIFKMDRGTNRRPTKDISHTFAGLISIERYDRMRSPATILINRRDVIPNILFFNFAAV